MSSEKWRSCSPAFLPPFAFKCRQYRGAVFFLKARRATLCGEHRAVAQPQGEAHSITLYLL